MNSNSPLRLRNKAQHTQSSVNLNRPSSNLTTYSQIERSGKINYSDLKPRLQSNKSEEKLRVNNSGASGIVNPYINNPSRDQLHSYSKSTLSNYKVIPTLSKSHIKNSISTITVDNGKQSIQNKLIFYKNENRRLKQKNVMLQQELDYIKG